MIAPGVPGGMQTSLPISAPIAMATRSLAIWAAATPALIPIAACIAGEFSGLPASIVSPAMEATWAAIPAIIAVFIAAARAAAAPRAAAPAGARACSGM